MPIAFFFLGFQLSINLLSPTPHSLDWPWEMKWPTWTDQRSRLFARLGVPCYALCAPSEHQVWTSAGAALPHGHLRSWLVTRQVLGSEDTVRSDL